MKEEGEKVGEMSTVVNDGACAICLDEIELQETALVKGCEHAYCDLEVNFESNEKASIVYAALNVDKELQPDKVKRVMSVSDGKLAVHYAGILKQ